MPPTLVGTIVDVGSADTFGVTVLVLPVNEFMISANVLLVGWGALPTPRHSLAPGL